MSIAARFGTLRGVVRLALTHVQVLTVPRADLSRAKRLVFVCHGNICRSAFAEALARSLGLEAASFGLSSGEGWPAHPPVVAAAATRGVDLSAHRSTRIEDFEPRPGDLNLVMEVRQIARLRADSRFADAPIDLLGRYGGVPHLHDPYGLSDAFVATSLDDIDRSIRALTRRIGGR